MKEISFMVAHDLTDSERGMVGARAREIFDRQAKTRMSAGGGDKKSDAAKSGVADRPPPISHPKKARDAAGEAVGVSGRTIDQATRVLRDGVRDPPEDLLHAGQP